MIAQEQEARINDVGAIEAKYTVKIDNNGYVCGYGLLSTANTATPTSEFEVRADKFTIAPTAAAVDAAAPFFVLTSPQTVTVNGETITLPAGTYMNTALIGSATIKSAQIKDLAVDKLVAAGATLAEALIGNASIGFAKIKDDLQSTDFASGSRGWRIAKGGTV